MFFAGMTKIVPKGTPVNGILAISLHGLPAGVKVGIAPKLFMKSCIYARQSGGEPIFTSGYPHSSHTLQSMIDGTAQLIAIVAISMSAY